MPTAKNAVMKKILIDIKFLVQNHGVRTLRVVKKYVSQSEYEKIQKLINDVKV
jgi:hypothetical protein